MARSVGSSAYDHHHHQYIQYLLIPNSRTPWNCGNLGSRTIRREMKLITKWLGLFLVYMQVIRNLEEGPHVITIRKWIYLGTGVNHLHDDRHSCEELARWRKLFTIVDLLPLGESAALVIGSFTDPVQEIKLSQVVQDIGNCPGQRYRDNGQGHDNNMQCSEEEQVNNPDSSAVQPGHFRIGTLGSICRTQHGQGFTNLSTVENTSYHGKIITQSDKENKIQSTSCIRVWMRMYLCVCVDNWTKSARFQILLDFL